MDPEDRIDYWIDLEGHIDGEILASDLTYKQAQKREANEARRRGCFHKAGGARRPGRVWSVYRVWGGIVRARNPL